MMGFALLWLHLLKAKQFVLCVRQVHIPTLATVCKTLETKRTGDLGGGGAEL